MTSKDKAKELCKRFQKLLFVDISIVNEDYIHPDSKQCALICVDEIMSCVAYEEAPNWCPDEQGWHYWQQVKQEIEKL